MAPDHQPSNPRRSYSPQARSHKPSTRERSPQSGPRHSKKPERKKSPPQTSRILPFGARQLVKHDFNIYRSLFANYLDIQKSLILDEIDHTEAKGRWKSFLGKWNRGELAEGWYDPTMLQKAIQPLPKSQSRRRPSPIYDDKINEGSQAKERNTEESSSEDEGPGPALPGIEHKSKSRPSRSGPAIPTMQDLELKRELDIDDVESHRKFMRAEQRAAAMVETERLNDLAPRAEPGTRERQLEKKREFAASNRAFAAAKEGDGGVDVPEADLMGDDDGGFKRRKQEVERKKNERETRREEVMRARREEREERSREFREREERTMRGLVELARSRFG